MPRLPKEKIVEDVPSNVTRKPRVSVIERRKRNPQFRARATVELTQPGFTVRWGNSGIPGRHFQLVNSKGWEPVQRSEVKDLDEIADLVDQGDGIVRRGERGREILYKMLTTDYQEVKRKEAALRVDKGRNKAKVTAEVAQAAAEKFGGEAGDWVAGEHGGVIKPIMPTMHETTERLRSEDANAE